MGKTLLIFLFQFLPWGCNSSSKNQSVTYKSEDSLNSIKWFKKIERYFPEKKNIERFDTLITSRQLQVNITKIDLDSYVINEYQVEEEGLIHVDKYRDAKISLIIKQNSKTLLDTILIKDQFSHFAENGFTDIAIFQGYWFERLEKNRITFSGVICKPETDWAMDFHHYFDLKKGNLIFIKEISDVE